ncbi:MAG: prepilin-type N-terminal cleavage/methylation domain-containing protein [Acidimicrobiales bacterium]
MTRHGLRIRCGDKGFGLIEMVIALALLAIIIVPIVRIIAETQTGSDALHLRAEAADLATQALETAQYETSNGVNPTSGVTTSTQRSGNNSFSVALDYELVAGTSTDSSICAAPPGQLSSQIWPVKAKVSWGPGPQRGTVVETTLISPAEVDLADTNAAEIAVPVYNADDSTYETTTPITITVNGSAPSGTVPSNETYNESENTGSTGCAVFPNLYAGGGETYTITVSPPLGWVDPNELFYNSPTSAQFGKPITVQPNQVTPVTNPNLILAPAATMTVNFQTVSFTPVTVPSVITVSTIKSVTHSGGFPGVSPGMIISGTGIASGATVTSISGNTLVMSLAATASGTVTLSFSGSTLPAPAPYLPITVDSSNMQCDVPENNQCVLGNLTSTGTAFFSSTSPQSALLFATATATTYSAWTGDQVDSDPGVGNETSFQATSGTPVTITLPVYPLQITVTSGAATGFTATDVDTMTVPGTSNTYAAGLPLGQFQLGATNLSTTKTVSPAAVWITAAGVCQYSSLSAIPATPCSSPSTTGISVSVS